MNDSFVNNVNLAFQERPSFLQWNKASDSAKPGVRRVLHLEHCQQFVESTDTGRREHQSTWNESAKSLHGKCPIKAL